MSTSKVCIECGEPIESLYVEFSEGNIRLVRCPHCSEVADKYIEYELFLVFIDIILHRLPAYRHLMFNRHDFEAAMHSIKWTLGGVVVINSLLKFIMLHDTTQYDSTSLGVIHLIISSLLEHGASVVAIFWFLWCSKELPQLFAAGQNKFIRKLYFSIAFSEYLKVVAIILQIFDSEPRFFFMFGLLLISIQFMSLQSLMSRNSYSRLLLAIIMGNACRFIVRTVLYDIDVIIRLGLIG